jgi:hypothetical protein
MKKKKFNYKKILSNLIYYPWIFLLGLLAFTAIIDLHFILFIFLASLFLSLRFFRKKANHITNKTWIGSIMILLSIFLFFLGASLVPEPVDSDNDGWTDSKENLKNTDPKNPDTDFDGVIDSQDAFPLNSSDNRTTDEYLNFIEEKERISKNKELISNFKEIATDINDKNLITRINLLEEKLEEYSEEELSKEIINLKHDLDNTEAQNKINEKRNENLNEELIKLAKMSQEFKEIEIPEVFDEILEGENISRKEKLIENLSIILSKSTSEEESFISRISNFWKKEWTSNSMISVYEDLDVENEIERKELWKSEYDKKWVNWTGYVLSVDDTFTGKPRVLAKASPIKQNDNGFDTHATIIFDKNEKEKFIGLRKGYKIEFQGELYEYRNLLGGTQLYIKDGILINSSAYSVIASIPFEGWFD